MKIVIDSREPEQIIDLFNNLIKNKNIFLEKKTLDIGDMQIYENDNDNEATIIFERKSLSDLLASIKDGRYNEQSIRLDGSLLPNHNIYYIIEGNIECIKNLKDKQIIYSSLFTLSYFKGFSIINSLNINQTVNIICHFADKLNRENKKIPYFIKNNNKDDNKDDNKDNNKELLKNNSYSSVIKPCKKANITKNNILEIMLMQIPGVSYTISSIISKEFVTMSNLLKCLGNNPDCLNNLYSLKNKRKISKNVIHNIKEYLIE